VAKTHGGSTSFKSPTPKQLTIGSPRPLSTKKGAYSASASNQQLVDQPTNVKKKEVDDKKVSVDPSIPNKKLRINTGLEAK
jgi:hypothetical protein